MYHNMMPSMSTNAFNSIPHEVILYELTRHRVCAQFRKYCKVFLTVRHCEYGKELKAGTP